MVLFGCIVIGHTTSHSMVIWVSNNEKSLQSKNSSTNKFYVKVGFLAAKQHFYILDIFKVCFMYITGLYYACNK